MTCEQGGYDLPLLWSDDCLAVFDKPSGLVVHRGWAADRLTAVDLARNLLGCRVFPVHRLDRGTSGVLVFALTSEVARAVQECFQAFEVRKVYWALARGVPPSSGEIDHPIPRSEGGLRVPAQTSFRCLGTTGQFSLVEASPKTGRLHQIRRHFKHISHPLVGDVRYGKGSINRMFRTEFGLHRLALHAKQIEFPHPSSGQCLRVVSSLPKDLLDVLEGLGITVPFGGCENATAVGPSFSSLDPS